MNKLNILVAIIIAFIATSCSNSIESKIEREFRSYVSGNFDDPGAVKQIVSVELIDSKNNDSINRIMGLAVKMAEDKYKKDSLKVNKKIFNSETIKVFVEKVDYVSYSTRKKYINSLNEYGSFLAKDLEYYLMAKESINFMIKSDSLPKFDFSSYRIKFRQKVGDNLVIREHFAIFDHTKEKDNIEISPVLIDDNYYPKYINDLIFLSEAMTEYLNKYHDIVSRADDAFIEVKLELEENGITL